MKSKIKTPSQWMFVDVLRRGRPLTKLSPEHFFLLQIILRNSSLTDDELYALDDFPNKHTKELSTLVRNRYLALYYQPAAKREVYQYRITPKGRKALRENAPSRCKI